LSAVGSISSRFSASSSAFSSSGLPPVADQQASTNA